MNRCQQLESICVWCGSDYYLNECELLEVVTKYSSKTFYELEISWIIYSRSMLFTEELELIFISWSNRIPQKSLSLINIINNKCQTRLKVKKESMDVIKNFNKK